MINSNIIYSTPISQQSINESSIYRKPEFQNGELIQIPKNKSLTLQDSFLKSVQKFPKKKAIGIYNQKTKNYNYITYQQFLNMSTYIGSAIKNLNLIEQVISYKDRQENNSKLQLIGIHSKNRAEWLILDMANVLYGFTMVPLYDTLGPNSIQYIIEHSEISTCFCTPDTIKSLLKCKNLDKLQNIVILLNSGEILDQEIQQKINSRNLNLYTWDQLLQIGQDKVQKYANIDPNDCYTLSYTSGTTGNPKAAMISHKNMIASIASREFSDVQIQNTDTHLSYLPLAHIYERKYIIFIIHFSATVCFYRGDITKLKEDQKLCKPSVFCSVPRIYNKFYQSINKILRNNKLSNLALNTKLENLQKTGQYTHTIYDKLIFQNTKNLFGGNCRCLVSGSAPLATEVINFMKVVMCCPLVQGYGLTESAASGFIAQEDDPNVGHVGGPIANIEFKLKSVDEMNYSVNDKNDKGKNTPRGEILFRGPVIFQGYYKDKEKTQETVDKEGWLHTGDIGVINENGSLTIIDRKKNIFKLSQGEYVSPEKVQNIYMTFDGIEQIFVHGNSFQNYCVAVIYPKENYLKEIGQQLQIQGNFQQLCQNQKINQFFQKQIDIVGKKQGLQGFEMAKKIILIPNSFQEINIVTNTMKLQRQKAIQYFQQELDQLYNNN